jgi:LysR family transcriptional regulator, nod-box dependent transcriptional activator
MPIPSARRLDRLDLNLLVTLEALLTLRNVTAAAARLHIAQPSMSGALARLREFFGDALLVPVGRRLELTALGEMLLDPVREAIEKIEDALSLRPDFDPKTARRRFLLSASDATVLTLLTEVIRRAEALAPGVTVELLPAEPGEAVDWLNRRKLDFFFSLEALASRGHPSTLVIQDTFHCIAWTGNRKVRKHVTLQQYTALGHVVTRYGFERSPGFDQYGLDQLGIQRRVEVTCATPALLGPLVVGTQRIATVATRLGKQQARTLPINIFESPVDHPPLRVVAQWHRTREQDGATRWLRELIVKTAEDLDYLEPTAHRG